MSTNGADGSLRCSSLVPAWGMATLLLVLGTAALILALTSCSGPLRTQVPIYEKARALAFKEGPLSEPPAEVRKKLRCDDKPVAVKPGPGIPHGGLLFTNDRAACLRAIVAERDKLRATSEARELQMRTRRIISDAAIKRLVEETKRTWWERYSTSIIGTALFVVGSAITIAIMRALTGGKAISVQTHILSEARR